MQFSRHTPPPTNRKISHIDSSSGMGHKRSNRRQSPRSSTATTNDEEYDNASISISLDIVSPTIDIRVPPSMLTPLTHLKGRERMRYTVPSPIEKMDLFQVALELFNRKGVRPMRNMDDDCAPEICAYFYECVGRMKRKFQWCVQCGDREREFLGYDYYYVDLVEIAQSRGARCSGCMYRVLKQNIQGSETALRQGLRYLRVEQPDGVLVHPFLITCGY